MNRPLHRPWMAVVQVEPRMAEILPLVDVEKRRGAEMESGIVDRLMPD